jgi:pimeloyl-ACP methyl ester carboxylesterase
LALCLALAACATPAERLLRRGAELGFAPLNLQAEGYALQAFYQPATGGRRVLHVYLEGDGTPWSDRTHVAADPTPRKPLMLSLMALDSAPALYLGRPCYNGHAKDTGCHPLLWTHRRYAPEIVAAMAAALQAFQRERGFPELVLLGHSGGGALALLLAERLTGVQAVATLAGNADIDVWADLHGYSRLAGSLNPARMKLGGPPEFHWLGAEDARIPPRAFLPVLAKRPGGARIRVLPGVDHARGWERHWQEILAELPNR